MKYGFLTSQIGYDQFENKICLVRADERNFLPDSGRLAIYKDEVLVHETQYSYWGEIWHSHFWKADFSDFTVEGEFELCIELKNKTKLKSNAISIFNNHIWNSTFQSVAIDAIKARREAARNGVGFKDCGHHWREIPSHTGLILGLLDVLEVGFHALRPEELLEIRSLIHHGIDLLARAQDAAKELGLGDGGLIHEFPTVLHLIPGSIAQAAIVFAKAGRLFMDTEPVLGAQYIERGKRAFRFLREECPPFIGGFYGAGHGAPEDFTPPGTWMTRDLLSMLWASVELWMAGSQVHQRIGAEIAAQVLSRQVPKDRAENGLHGHFYAFDDLSFTEKANTHHHWGHDTGGFLPHYVYPLVLMVRLWGYHPDNAKWRNALVKFSEGYLIPACNRNPFGILPIGHFENEGLLTFSGPWHGCNVTLGYASALASQLEFVLGLPGLRQIANANLQWICGLNTGVFQECFDGCLAPQMEVPENGYQSISMIDGLGNHFAHSWTRIKGTIVNGFSNNRQFQHENFPEAKTDGPLYFTDEDWIPHTGGFLAGLAWLKETSLFSKAFKDLAQSFEEGK